MILHLFVDSQTGSLYNLDRTLTIGNKSDLGKLLGYDVIVVISEASSAIYARGKHAPDYTICFGKFNVMEELLEIYHCKYDKFMMVFTKLGVDVYSIDDYPAARHKWVYKFNDYDKDQITDESFKEFVNAIGSSNTMPGIRYSEMKCTLDEFMSSHLGGNIILIRNYNTRTNNLRFEIHYLNYSDYYAMLTIKQLMSMENSLNFDNLQKLDSDIKTKLVGFYKKDNGKYDVCDPEARLGFVPEYYGLSISNISP